MNIFLFISDFLNKNWDGIYQKLYVIAILGGVTFVAMMIDLHFGIKKAKKEGEYISSTGMKRTISKVRDYGSAMAYGLLFDILTSVFTYFLPFPLNTIPIFTLIISLIIVYTEFKSVKEKGNQKVWRQMRNNGDELVNIYKALKDEGLLEEIKERIKQKENENS